MLAGALAALVASFLACWGMLASRRAHERLSIDDTIPGLHKVHRTPVPRIGSFGILAGVIAGAATLEQADATWMLLFLLAALPAFTGGFLEDLTRKVTPYSRLLFAFGAAATGYFLIDARITDLDLPYDDLLFRYEIFAFGFTLFAVGGFAHATNIIDGMNGLSGFVAGAMKIHEPAPYTRINPRPTRAQWAEDPRHEARLRRALEQQGYREIRTRYENGKLAATLANARIASMPRAVGRAARTMLSFAPLEVRELEVTYRQGPLAFATYRFADAKTLQRYFNGMTTRERLAQTVAIAYARPEEEKLDEDREAALAAFEEPLPDDVVIRNAVPQLFGYRANLAGGQFRIRPGLSAFFNDPSGALKLDLSALATWDRALAPRTFFASEAKFTIAENVSDVTQPSNSLLPHVRTDVAEHRRAADAKLLKALFGDAAPRLRGDGRGDREERRSPRGVRISGNAAPALEKQKAP